VSPGRAPCVSVFWRGAQSEPRGHRHQIRKRAGLHLTHHLPSVRLHGNQADAEFGTHLFVQLAGNDELHHLAFARCQ